MGRLESEQISRRRSRRAGLCSHTHTHLDSDTETLSMQSPSNWLSGESIITFSPRPVTMAQLQNVTVETQRDIT